MCCGRPLYDYGMLKLARRLLHEVLDGLRDEIRAGTPVVAREPSCGAVFRNELTNMLPDYEILDTGCCGLAGSFGYGRGERYEVSIKAGERMLLPRVRDASPHTLVMTDGFSCRSQIEHGSERGALHLAQVVQMALREGPNGPSTPRPEQRYARLPR